MLKLKFSARERAHMSRQRPKCLALLFAQLFCVATGSAGGVVVTTLAGSLGHQSGSANGVGTASSFNFPRTVALSHDASFALIADTGNNAIRYINMTTSAVSTLAGATLVFGNADGTAATFNAPFGVAIAGGFALVVSHASNHGIVSNELHRPRSPRSPYPPHSPSTE